MSPAALACEGVYIEDLPPHPPPPPACYNRKGQFAEAIEDYNLALSKDQMPRRQHPGGGWDGRGLRSGIFSGGGSGSGGGGAGGASLLESSSGAATPVGPGFAGAHHFSGFPVSGAPSTPGRPASAGAVLGGGAPPSPMAGLRKGSFRVGASE